MRPEFVVEASILANEMIKMLLAEDREEAQTFKLVPVVHWHIATFWRRSQREKRCQEPFYSNDDYELIRLGLKSFAAGAFSAALYQDRIVSTDWKRGRESFLSRPLLLFAVGCKKFVRERSRP